MDAVVGTGSSVRRCLHDQVTTVHTSRDGYIATERWCSSCGVKVDLKVNSVRAGCEDHTPAPEGYLAWHSWAEEMSKTHSQVQCPACGKWAIWVKRGGA